MRKKHTLYLLLQAEALLKRMVAIDGDKSVAQDMATRQKIASFPPEIYDPDLLSKIKGMPICNV